ncbi:SMP-30/gluconolactonase/LRE family protein [Sphingopyxis sp. MWB1]|uniref:SMP-30/gluconolactonase/LRE family protein n=1 Tax=Sphingopyxis sp. MWB1 TaxID=1537715 RepID=UPI001F40FB29|nr:SMP-30/gluconolactonase/LRE family protein [Sphingopyxis sp. MWB1]
MKQKLLSFAAGATAIMLFPACASLPAGAPLFQARDYVGDGVFTAGIEGPATGPDGALYVVNFGREGTIGRVVPAGDGTGRASLFTDLPPGSIGNGIRFDGDGAMIVADYKGHQLLRIDSEGQATVFASLPHAHQPNDIARAPSGIFYASDPDWASESGQLWRIDRDGQVKLIENNMGTTNGIELSPDGRRLYVGESVQRRIWLYDLDAEGRASNKRLFASFADHGLDGMRCDRAGNLYVARYGAGHVAVLAPDGREIRRIPTWGKDPTNIAFGGPDGRSVYVTLQDRGAIEHFRTAVPGREYGGSR